MLDILEHTGPLLHQLYTWTWLCLTAPLPQVSNFRVIEEGLFSLRLGWMSPPGKTSGFKILIPKCALKWCSLSSFINQLNSLYKSQKNQWDNFKISVFCVCPSADQPGFIYEKLLPGDTSSHVIDNLEEDKEYRIIIFAVYTQGPSQPISLVGKTCKFIATIASLDTFNSLVYDIWHFAHSWRLIHFSLLFF